MPEVPDDLPAGVRLTAPVSAAYDQVLSAPALAFVASLSRQFRGRVEALLQRRQDVQARYDEGALPNFLSETVSTRQGGWTVAAVPADLCDRRVEITGPPVRKMIVNALNSGAKVFMADFEDSCAPTWDNLVQGQQNLLDAVRGTLGFTDPQSGKRYEVGPTPATLMVRPRGWHLWERHLRVDEQPVPGALFDFGLYFWHNAQALVGRGSGPYFYLPKLQSHLEARLWNDVFVAAQGALGLPRGSIKATVLIETLPAAFEMDEILYELREHSAGLNCGRWDYIFSVIKTRRADPKALLPDRRLVGMTQPFMRAYSQLLVRTCHRRGAHAMGGMAAQIPIKEDPEANRLALTQVEADKLREVEDGHDGTWVAHPALVPVAQAVFDAHMPRANQIERQRDDVQVLAEDLLRVPEGARTRAGLRLNLSVGVQYLEAWLGGNGCVPINHLMEDAATAEISRAQVWQWCAHHAQLEDGTPVTPALIHAVLNDEMEALHARVGAARFGAGHYQRARELFERWSVQPTLEDFLTVPASAYLHPNQQD